MAFIFLRNSDCDHLLAQTVWAISCSFQTLTVQKGKLQASHRRAHMPQSAAFSMLVFGFQMPLRTDLKMLSERKSRSLGVLLQVLRGKKCLFSRLSAAAFCNQECGCLVLPLSAITLYPQSRYVVTTCSLKQIKLISNISLYIIFF